MRVAFHPGEIRRLVHQTLLELDAQEDALADLDEHMLIDGGRYIARSYRVEDFLAMWLIDVGLVQFYDGEGNMLRTINLFDELQPQCMAA